MQEPEDKESIARAHFPYRAEYCKTSRAKCKKCKEVMLVDTLKLAHMVKSRFHDGYDANYYHLTCFFSLKRPDSVAEIGHFETLKYEDQKMLEEAVETKGKSILGSEAVKSKGKEKDPNALVNYDDFLVEYAKSSRSKCNICDQNIEKALVRMGKLDFAAETAWTNGPVTRWYHVECFAKSLEQLDFSGKVEKIPNFNQLEEEDQKMLKKKIKASKQPAKRGVETDSASKRVKTENVKSEPEPVDDREEKLLKRQSDKFFKLHKLVSTMRRKDIEDMLKAMDQKHNYKASTILVDMATDVLLFGPLARCPQCKQKGGIQLRGSSYICTAGTETEPCTYETRSPKRLAPYVPDEIEEKYDFFTDGTYRFKPRERIFPSKLVKAIEQREAEVNHLVLEGAPLDGLNIGVISWKALKNPKTKIQSKISLLGGTVVTALDSSIFVILTNKNELEKDTPKMEVAKALKVPFASDEFIFNIKTKADVVPEVKKCLIEEWDGDLNERFNKMINRTPPK